MITKEQFEAYEAVRVSGVTNMWDGKVVCKLSGLNREQHIKILKNYTELKDKYLNDK